MDAREAAYLALLSSLRHEKFIAHSLEKWQQQFTPSPLDCAFAQEMAFGACRMAKALDYLAGRLAAKQTLSVKLKERALIRLALYQYYFMDKVPLYAIANETVKLAHTYCHRTFVPFLNALLRKLETTPAVLPAGQTTADLSIRYSYPEFYVQALMRQYPADTVEAVLQAGNSPAATMLRLRPGCKADAAHWSPYVAPLPRHPQNALPLEPPAARMGVLTDPAGLKAVAASSYCYIQNATPATLIAELAGRTIRPPQRILDLCASPGGKLLAAHDAFPQAELFGNDVSPDKLARLKHNADKYGIAIQLSCGLGEEFASPNTFDLIILDVPCSNSGVLNKRPEARWRLTQEALSALEETQRRLLDHAYKLLSPAGAIWYMTCSILDSENEAMADAACQRLPLTRQFSKTVLPNADGWDGGYGCLLTKR